MARRKKQVPYRPPTQGEKTRRAFAAYLALLDAADRMRNKMSSQLHTFDLSMGGFRVLELLHRQGPLSVSSAAKERQCKRQNMDVILAPLLERGWVRRETLQLRPVKIKKSRLPKAMRVRKREGRRVGMVCLTPLGEEFIRMVLPKHKKVVKAFMRVLEGKEQMSLARMCNKVREGDVRKFVNEITHSEVYDQD
jgi:DNA-binding MarR family transcriptional regulator